ncbi:MAG: hypothetical protein KQ78_01982 [Candidatus Izimaplasma bacterium HR2]|nr:MAG: hypothetical protein KQ78_01982 [Candidatus Izimaplasma bacterium HR2]
MYPSKDTFRNIIHGVSYRTVGNIPKIKHAQTGVLRFSKEEILEIRRLYDNKEKTTTELACIYKVTYNPMRSIVLRKSYKHIK